MIRSLWQTLLLGSLLGCAAQGPEAVALISGLAGAQQVVTLTNLHPHGSKLSAVNYQQDGLIPVCSAVTILSLSNEKLEFRVESTGSSTPTSITGPRSSRLGGISRATSARRARRPTSMR